MPFYQDKEALDALQALIDGYINDCQRYIHGFSTIQLESLNGTARKRVDKERNWTVMYCALFDAGILERNEGTFSLIVHFVVCCMHVCLVLNSFFLSSGKDSSALIDLFEQLGLEITYEERTRWLKILKGRKKRDDIRSSPRCKLRRQQLKRHAIAETGMQLFMVFSLLCVCRAHTLLVFSYPSRPCQPPQEGHVQGAYSGGDCYMGRRLHQIQSNWRLYIYLLLLSFVI